jgi:enamine deaminase RidA (YjgF/YER057c/UK114 family)
MGTYFPAMVLVEVGGLVDNAAKIEIEGMAVIPA